jgi:hypothetical protein
LPAVHLCVARPKIPLRLLLGYGLTISFGQFAFLFCAINLGMPAVLATEAGLNQYQDAKNRQRDTGDLLSL